MKNTPVDFPLILTERKLRARHV